MVVYEHNYSISHKFNYHATFQLLPRDPRVIKHTCLGTPFSLSCVCVRWSATHQASSFPPLLPPFYPIFYPTINTAANTIYSSFLRLHSSLSTLKKLRLHHHHNNHHHHYHHPTRVSHHRKLNQTRGDTKET